jgi:RNA polymerase sigma factor (sigma-70 family)
MTPMPAQRPRADRAFERIYRQNVRRVYGYALAVLRSPDDAEDVTRTTFLNAYRAHERGVLPRSPDNWLISIAHGLCDQRARQESQLDAVAYEDHAEDAVPDDEGPRPKDVRRAVGRLPFDQRAALIMREVEGRSYAELVEILGVSNAKVEALLFRARRALRGELEGALTCHQAERAVSRRLDGLLDRAERKQLRSHLRACDDCARLARSQRTQRRALRALTNVALPVSLVSFFAKPSGSPGRA